MKRFLSIAMALCIGLTMSIDANAKRFGGGKARVQRLATKRVKPLQLQPLRLPVLQAPPQKPAVLRAGLALWPASLPVACWRPCSWAAASRACSSSTS